MNCSDLFVNGTIEANTYSGFDYYGHFIFLLEDYFRSDPAETTDPFRIFLEFSELTDKARTELQNIGIFLRQEQISNEERKMLGGFLYFYILRGENNPWKNIIRLFNDDGYSESYEFQRHLVNVMEFLHLPSEKESSLRRLIKRIIVDYVVLQITLGIVNDEDIWF